jgi:hypothetical protein
MICCSSSVHYGKAIRNLYLSTTNHTILDAAEPPHKKMLTPMISPNLTAGLLGGDGSSAASSSCSATATAPSASPSSASALATTWVVRRGEVYRERRRNEDATVRTCGGAERWERRAWGSREPVTAAVAEAAAIGMLGRANVSAAEHGTEKAGVAAAGGLRKRRYPPIYLWEGVVRLHAGPTVYPEVGPISTVGLGEPLRRSG